MRNRLRVTSRGISFDFFYEKGLGTELHITVAHGTAPEDAIATYFAGTAEYDSLHKRFKTVTPSHVLLWGWADPGKVIYVISCWKREDEEQA